MIHARYSSFDPTPAANPSNSQVPPSGEAKRLALDSLRSDSKIAKFFQPLTKDSSHSSAQDLKANTTNGITSAPDLLGTFPQGTLIEIVGNASTTAMAALTAEVQQKGEPVAWIMGDKSSLYPPDLARAGVCLEALACIRVRQSHFGPPLERLRAAEMLIRSGGFGLVLLEVSGESQLPARALSRLHALARRNKARVVFRVAYPMGTAGTASLGPLVGLQLRVNRQEHSISVEVLKQKGGMTLPQEVVLSEQLLWPLGATPRGQEEQVAPFDLSASLAADLHHKQEPLNKEALEAPTTQSSQRGSQDNQAAQPSPRTSAAKSFAKDQIEPQSQPAQPKPGPRKASRRPKASAQAPRAQLSLFLQEAS